MDLFVPQTGQSRFPARGQHVGEGEGRMAKTGRILIVEDHADTALVYSRLLSAEGHEVKVANTLAGARALLEAEAFDLMLADIALPDGNACELLESGQAGQTKSIAISGFTT